MRKKQEQGRSVHSTLTFCSAFKNAADEGELLLKPPVVLQLIAHPAARLRHRLDTQAARVAPEFLQRQAAPHAPDVQRKIPAPVAPPVRERRPRLALGYRLISTVRISHVPLPIADCPLPISDLRISHLPRLTRLSQFFPSPSAD